MCLLGLIRIGALILSIKPFVFIVAFVFAKIKTLSTILLIRLYSKSFQVLYTPCMPHVFLTFLKNLLQPLIILHGSCNLDASIIKVCLSGKNEML